MFDSPTSHAQVFAGFGHQSSTDSFGTVRRQTGTRIPIMANAKRIYDEVRISSRTSFEIYLFSLVFNGQKS